MERRPLAASTVLSVVAFIFAGVLGVGMAIYFLAAWNSASLVGLLVGGIILFLFGTLALSAVYRLRVAPVWPVLGVVAGFIGFMAWLAYAFSDMD
jgi:hypothetical protein